jgi:hypothetical protein
MHRIKREWYKIPLVCIVKLISMLAFQTVIRGLVLGRMLHLLPGEPPDSSFLIRISIFSIIATCLFTIAYLLGGDKLSIDGSVGRAFVFGMFIYFSNYLPQSMGLIGAGGDERLMSFNATDAIFDFFSYIVTFAFTGWIFKSETNTQTRVPKQQIVKALLIGGILFPVLMVVITQGVGFLFPTQSIASVLRIAPEFIWRFYCSFYLLFIVTGILVPLFYYLSAFNKDTAHKELGFALKYALLIWAPIVFAMAAFGVDVFPCIVFSLESVIAFQILMKVCGGVLDLRQNEKIS